LLYLPKPPDEAANVDEFTVAPVPFSTIADTVVDAPLNLIPKAEAPGFSVVRVDILITKSV
jgi:hypothetical protein